MQFLKFDRLFLLAVSMLVTGCPLKSTDYSEVRIGEVKAGDIVQEVMVPGVIASKRRLVVFPLYEGYIKKLYVNTGDTVHAGDPLVLIVSSPMGHESGYPQRAQFRGVVTDVLRNEGEWVANSKESPIIVVDDNSSLTVECAVPEIDIAKYKMGLAAKISPIALTDRVYDGKITYVAQTAKLKNSDRYMGSAVEFSVKVQILNPDDRLRAGMTAAVKVILESVKNVAMLPHEFVKIDEGKATVQTTDGIIKDIQLGMSDDHGIEIKSGLTVGEKVRQVDFYTEKL